MSAGTNVATQFERLCFISLTLVNGNQIVGHTTAKISQTTPIKTESQIFVSVDVNFHSVIF